MATQAQKQELKMKLESLIRERFGGDRRAAFIYYDQDGDGMINRAELMDMLKDSGVGNWLTRGLWASGVLAELDRDGDGAITAEELEAASHQP